MLAAWHDDDDVEHERTVKCQCRHSTQVHASKNCPIWLKDKGWERIGQTKNCVRLSVKSSEWAIPIVFVIKHDCCIHICGDYKIIFNPNFAVEQYKLTRIEDMQAKLEKGEKFTKKDLQQAYPQLILDELKQLTTINTNEKLY